MTKTGLEFGISVIVICLIFEIYDLEFLFLQYSTTPGRGYLDKTDNPVAASVKETDRTR
jgi:hypothetical protein